MLVEGLSCEGDWMLVRYEMVEGGGLAFEKLSVMSEVDRFWRESGPPGPHPLVSIATGCVASEVVRVLGLLSRGIEEFVGLCVQRLLDLFPWKPERDTRGVVNNDEVDSRPPLGALGPVLC